MLWHLSRLVLNLAFDGVLLIWLMGTAPLKRLTDIGLRDLLISIPILVWGMGAVCARPDA